MWKRKKDKQPEKLVADGAVWSPLVEPLRWEPQIGEVIVGRFVGFQERSGIFGLYRVVMIRSSDCVQTISGSMLVRLLEGGAIKPGMLIRVVYCGTRLSSSGNTYKAFEAFATARMECVGNA